MNQNSDAGIVTMDELSEFVGRAKASPENILALVCDGRRIWSIPHDAQNPGAGLTLQWVFFVTSPTKEQWMSLIHTMPIVDAMRNVMYAPGARFPGADRGLGKTIRFTGGFSEIRGKKYPDPIDEP